MLLRLRLCLISTFSFASIVCGQSIESGAALAPTNFGKSFSLEDNPDALMRMPGTSLRDSGGPASLTGLSIRGARAKEVSVSLEGIPLNSAGSGDFDLGLLSPWALTEGRLLRGGYAPLSTSPNGNLLLRLPDKERTRLSVGGGDFGSIFVGAQIPHASFSFDRSDNDFPYKKNAVSSTRRNNSHQRYNFRTWWRADLWQVWGQLLYNDIDLPGPVGSVFPPSSTKTTRPTVAVQWRRANLSIEGKFDFQSQTVKSEPTNFWYNGRLQLRHQQEVLNNLQHHGTIEQSVDKLDSGNFSSPLRSTTALISSFLWTPYSGQLLHPSLRAEFVSDLNQKVSFHPGVGGRHELLSGLSLLWNFAFIQRAPTFNELYYQIPNFYIPNKELQPEQSLQGDVGYEWAGPGGLNFEQSFFINRKQDLIESVEIGGGLYQARNVGESFTWGAESGANFPVRENFLISAHYTFQKSRVGKNNREALYQPTHRVNVEPVLFPQRFVSVGIPLYIRSSVLATTTGERVPEQWDLGLNFKSQPLRAFPFETKVVIRNLLGWDREETLNYPLSNQPSVHATLTYTF